MTINALKVNQWLPEWDKINFDVNQHTTEPKHFFYVFSIKASTLRALSGIQRREANPETRQNEIGIQRKHDTKRSKEINTYLRYGYPWSSLTPSKQKDPNYVDMRKPGWLPTAIVINILEKDDTRRGKKVNPDDLISIGELNGISEIKLPNSYIGDDHWESSELPPIEVIDGQHRLWAFDPSEDLDFEIPVVAYHGLDISWQAYLFWVINIKPKKIDSSLAFDMYPLLRNEDWLEKGEDHIVYRETRAQELVEILWSFPESPWYKRIEMLGGKREFVSQNAWVRSLTATFIKKWQGTSGKPGGLFGSQMKHTDEVLNWSRAQQAAFLIYTWQELESEIKQTSTEWTQSLRNSSPSLNEIGFDEAFAGKYTLLNADQGVRAFLHTINDIFYLLADDLNLSSWDEYSYSQGDNLLETVKENINSIESKEFSHTVKNLCQILAQYDWRSSAAPNLSREDQLLKKRFRGSGGYKELREDILSFITHQENDFKSTAEELLAQMG